MRLNLAEAEAETPSGVKEGVEDVDVTLGKNKERGHENRPFNFDMGYLICGMMLSQFIAWALCITPRFIKTCCNIQSFISCMRLMVHFFQR